ncbi:hypothetical protein [Streptomyces sp. KN37]|uniref:hypothetical protein n=1 Tax=Streptomyces sp. KN37 TaxID=3090667 RepID=UPI002A74EA24|nr:hypothetical protein [Streptomyces sp. KN37]WPO73999.1 hypothetical protein R9806_26960 [Streptomyces sp. KN37]
MESTHNSQAGLKSGYNFDPLLDTPLADLLAEYGVDLYDSSITDCGFLGAFVESVDGRRALSMPRGRSEFEHDTAARMLLAEGLGIPSPRPPEPLRALRA